MTVFHRDAFVRACFKPANDAETYINGQVSKKTRKGTLRLQRKLAETGNLSVQISTRETQIETWIEDFLTLESSGWKGRSGTALASNDATRQFFTEMATRMSVQEKLVMLKVALDEKPISMICDLQQHQMGAAFKMAVDESLHDYSPGLIAELENIRRLHDSNIQFMDSCADPEHSMINRVWSDRTRYQSLVIALGGAFSRFATASMPLMQQFSEIIRKTRRKK